ncbi:LysR family transcriptional regulator [Arthrobacter frigidicola]|nr:LysR family transcriptional regulator [Arthrobacter frigidicola]
MLSCPQPRYLLRLQSNARIVFSMHLWHARLMDVVGACRVFICVSEAGSFTIGAAVACVSQPAASRRIAALENHWGGTLLDRSVRSAALTPFGRAMLPAARGIVEAAGLADEVAARALSDEPCLGVPLSWTMAQLASLIAGGRRDGFSLTTKQSLPIDRESAVEAGSLSGALIPAPVADAKWTVELGVGCRTSAPHQSRAFYLEQLRPSRGATTSRRTVWIDPEDQTTQVRDDLEQLRDAVGLHHDQVRVASSITDALVAAVNDADLLICSSVEALAWGLHWNPLGEMPLVRGYELIADSITHHHSFEQAIDGITGPSSSALPLQRA